MGEVTFDRELQIELLENQAQQHDEFCELLTTLLPKIKYMQRDQLQAALENVLQAPTQLTEQVHSQSKAVFAFKLAHRVHELVLTFVLQHLSDVGLNMDHWNHRLRQLGWAFIEGIWQKPWTNRQNWWPSVQKVASDMWMVGITKYPARWWKKTQLHTRLEINRHLKILKDIEQTFLEKAGELHERCVDERSHGQDRADSS
jgi:hypothetical protein